MPVCSPNLNITSNIPWNFHLIAEVLEEKSRYTPTNDASLCISQFPHLVLEVQSQENESDRYRMLLQAGCLARLGHALSKSPTQPCIISAIYITYDFEAEWYLVYTSQVEETTVGLISQKAAHYLCLDRSNMRWRDLIF